MVKVKVTMSLNDETVKEARELQRTLAGADNFSGLVDKLVSDWVNHTAIWNNMVRTNDNKFKKLKTNRDVGKGANVTE